MRWRGVSSTASADADALQQRNRGRNKDHTKKRLGGDVEANSNSANSNTDAKSNKDDDDEEPKVRRFSCAQNMDWLLGWFPRQLHRGWQRRNRNGIYCCRHGPNHCTEWAAPGTLWTTTTTGIIILILILVLWMRIGTMRGMMEATITTRWSRIVAMQDMAVVFAIRPTRVDHSSLLRVPMQSIAIPITAFYGNIRYVSLEKDSTTQHRTIRSNDLDVADEERRLQVQQQDAASSIPYSYWSWEDLESMHFPCQRPAWTKQQYLNCNTFHETSFDRDCASGDREAARKALTEIDLYMINHGFYRDVWVHRVPSDDTSTTTVFKTTRYEYDFHWRNLADVHREALIMERLTAYPNIISAYGHCGTSVLTEAVPHEFERYVIPGSGYSRKRVADPDSEASSLVFAPQNDLTAAEKLETALEMAESLAVVHGFQYGVIVHDDVQLQQWLRAADGRLKLGDFNRATIMNWNGKEDRYCKYSNGAAFGNVSVTPDGGAGALKNWDKDAVLDTFNFLLTPPLVAFLVSRSRRVRFNRH
jgi:hypothetical protein